MPTPPPKPHPEQLAVTAGDAADAHPLDLDEPVQSVLGEEDPGASIDLAVGTPDGARKPGPAPDLTPASKPTPSR